MKQVKTTSKECVNCGTSAEYKCTECGEYYCELCADEFHMVCLGCSPVTIKQFQEVIKG